VDNSSITIYINKKEISVTKFRLRKWLELEDNFSDFREAADSKDREKLTQSLYSYLSAALNIDTTVLSELGWYEVCSAFLTLKNFNAPNDKYPILKGTEKSSDQSWDYKGSTWYSWAHSIAGKYGWSIEYIADIDVDDAIALMQEILVDDQLTREWQWSMTEIAYPYNSSSKKSEFHPLDRPSWMQSKHPEIKITKIPKFLMPVGNIIAGKQQWKQ
jgi:hypothetical protein